MARVYHATQSWFAQIEMDEMADSDGMADSDVDEVADSDVDSEAYYGRQFSPRLARAACGTHATQRAATEHSRAAPSQPVRNFKHLPNPSGIPSTSRDLDPTIRLEKSRTPTNVRNWKDCHDREPDVGIGILIFIPKYRDGERSSEMTEYHGKYLGHGQSKTAFELFCPGARFHGNVIKVSKAQDIEPSVFRKTAPLHLTTSILYNCHGVDAHSDRRYHCWITERTIPLDEFCRDDAAIKHRCSLAAFLCILRAALHGLILSDCHFFNFGVLRTENATEHVVVIIDAGSRGIHPDIQWKKSEINTKVMHKFWKACAKESATNAEILNIWQSTYNTNTEECLKKATDAWQSYPFLSKNQESICTLQQAMFATASYRRSAAHATSAYKIMELVGRFIAPDQWNAAFASACYRAAIELRSELFSEEYKILDELYERITRTRHSDEEQHDVIMFWWRLHEYREREYARMKQSSEEQPLTQKEASHMLDGFKWNELWYDLNFEQQQSKRWRSTVNTILHKKAGWSHAARAIMEYGLPQLEQRALADDATEHINALGQFARDMADWLQKFASRMHTYTETEGYQKSVQDSLAALKKRNINARKSS